MLKIINKLLNVLTILFNSLEKLNSYLLVVFISRFSIIVLLLYNQGLINLYSKELLNFIILFTIIQLFYNLISSIIKMLINLNIELHVNNYYNLILNTLKILGLLLLLNKIYI